MRKTLATAAVLIAATLTPTAAATSWQWKYTVWMPKHWQNLAACESGASPPNWKHNSGTYEGAFGFYHGSWDQFRPARFPASASSATPWQQFVVARRIAAHYRSIAGSWGCWRGAEHEWVRAGLPERGTWR